MKPGRLLKLLGACIHGHKVRVCFLRPETWRRMITVLLGFTGNVMTHVKLETPTLPEHLLFSYLTVKKIFLECSFIFSVLHLFTF